MIVMEERSEENRLSKKISFQRGGGIKFLSRKNTSVRFTI